MLYLPLFKHIKEPASNVTDSQNHLQPWKPGNNVTIKCDKPGVTHAVTYTQEIYIR